MPSRVPLRLDDPTSIAPERLASPRLFSRKEAAAQLSISVRSLDYLVADKRLKSRRIGRRVLIPAAQLTLYINGDHTDPIRRPNP